MPVPNPIRAQENERPTFYVDLFIRGGHEQLQVIVGKASRDRDDVEHHHLCAIFRRSES